MRLVETKCPNCGSSIKVEDKKNKFFCEYCGTNFLLDDNTIKVKYLAAGEISEEQEFRNAETNLNKLKNYKDAYRIYSSLVSRYVDDKDIWIGLLRSFTRDFTYKTGSAVFKEQYQKYWNNYKALASDDDIAQYEAKYQNYVDNVKVTQRNNNLIVEQNNMQTEKCYLAVTTFLGFLGIHKFLKGKIAMGLIYLFTLGLFGFGWLYDTYQEYKKWPDSNQLTIIKYGLAFLVAGLGLIQLEYSIISFIVLILSAFSILDILWKQIKLKKKWIRIIVPCTLFIIGLMFGTKSIPEKCYGTWIANSREYQYNKIVISNDSVKLYKNDSLFEEMSGVYYKSTIHLNQEEGNVISIKYNAQKNELCILNEDNKCEITYNLKK